MKKVIIILLLLNIRVFGQTNILLDTYSNDNYFSLQTIKLNNTYIFSTTGIYKTNIFDGVLQSTQNYLGTGIALNELQFRDDGLFNIIYQKELTKHLDILLENDFILSLAAKTSNWNNLYRNKSIAGLRLNYYDTANLSAEIGYDNLIQLNKNFDGIFYRLNFSSPLINYFGNNLYLKLNESNSNLKENINYNDFDGFLGVNSYNNRGDFYSLIVKYKKQNRDLINITNYYNNEYNYIIEGRDEKKISIDLNSKINYNEYFSINALINAQDRKINRGKKENNISDTNYFKELDELSLNGLMNSIYDIDNYYQELGFEYNYRFEQNNIIMNDKYIDFKKILTQQENQRNNKSLRGRFFTKLRFRLSVKDTFQLNYSANIIRYDTPSEENHDDRDEFYSLFNLNYSHSFDEYFYSGIMFENYNNHLVYIKSQKSSFNNWNQIIRLSPYLHYNTNSFRIFSQFEVLANYTIYDFELLNSSIKSFSYRQIGYKDSIYIKLHNNNNIQFKLTSRLYERGVLYWKEFAEYPQNRNIEIFSKMILFTKPLYNIELGIGVRYFYLEQINLELINNKNNIGEFIKKIWGPELVFTTKSSSGNSLGIQAWLEFNNDGTIIPNFYINSNIAL